MGLEEQREGLDIGSLFPFPQSRIAVVKVPNNIGNLWNRLETRLPLGSPLSWLSEEY